MASYEWLPTWAKNLYTQTRARAKKRHQVFSLSPDVYAALVSKRCALSAIEFDTGPTATRHQKRPFAPSIDRLDNTKGYEEGNVRLVCVAVNIAMNIWGADVLWMVARGLVTTDSQRWRRALGIKCLPGVKAVYVTVAGEIRYKARLRRGGKEMYLGMYSSQEEAHQAVLAAQKLIKVPQERPQRRA